MPGANEQRGLGSIVVTPKFPLNRESALNGLRFGFGIPEPSDQDRGWIARRRQHAQLRRLCLGQVPGRRVAET